MALRFINVVNRLMKSREYALNEWTISEILKKRDKLAEEYKMDISMPYKEMKDHILRLNYQVLRSNTGNYVMRSWLDSRSNGKRLVKFQLGAFATYSKVRICQGCNYEVRHQLHSLGCIERPNSITDMMIEVEKRMVR